MILPPDMSPMALALEQARKAASVQEVPVGAVIVHPQKGVIASAYNEVLLRKDPTAHAEVLAIRAACAAMGSERLTECDLYVTLEPCAMCAQAISFARLRRLYFGAYDAKGGGVENGPRIFAQSTCHHAPEVYGGMDESTSKILLQQFFILKR